MSRPLLTVLSLLLSLAVAGCGGPREPVLGRAQAQTLTETMTITVRGVHEAVRLARGTDGESHLIEVRVDEGPPQLIDRIITLPYDEWLVGAPPPRRGERVTMTPAQWVSRAPTSGGRPFDGWQSR